MTVGELKKALDHINPDTEVKIRVRNGDGPHLYAIKDIKDLAVRFTLPEGTPQLHMETFHE